MAQKHSSQRTRYIYSLLRARHFRLKPWLICLIPLLFTACEKPEKISIIPPVNLPAPSDPAVTAFVDQTFAKAEAAFMQVLTVCLPFRDTVHTFLDTPDPENLEKTRQIWKDCHRAYLETAGLGDIVTFGSAHKQFLFTRLDHTPILPGYIDSIEAYPTSGIVNDSALIINQSTLQKQHQITAKEEVSIGFHALEFLLWGESTQAGNLRSAHDYHKQANAKKGQHRYLAQTRRRAYLAAATEIFIEDLLAISTVEDNQPTTQPLDAMTAISRSLITSLDKLHTLVEAQQGKTQGHSVYSHDEHADIAYFAKGFMGLFEAPADETTAPSLIALLEKKDPTIADSVAQKAKALKLLLPTTPKSAQKPLQTDTALLLIKELGDALRDGPYTLAGR